MGEGKTQAVHGAWDTGKLRVALIGVLMLIGLGVLSVRLICEQLGRGNLHRERIEQQSVRRIRIPGRRGKICSADLLPLAVNRECFELVFYPEEMRQSRRSRSISVMLENARRCCARIGVASPLNEKIVRRHLVTKPGLPLVVLSHLSFREAAQLYEEIRAIPGADIQNSDYRFYPQGSFAAHLIGSTRLDSRDLPGGISDREDFSYYLPDLVGRDGTERAFDQLPGGLAAYALRGRPGYSLVEVDSLGFIHRSLIEKIEPVHGNNVIMTIDSRAQKIAETLLGNRPGAIVVLDGSNGDILAAASAPRYDLSRFSPTLSPEYYRELTENPGRPLLNRAFQGSYTPGSILKVLTALAFLNSGIDPETRINCTGASIIGNASIRCAAHRSGGHGPLNLTEALRSSCNCYMIANALKTGVTPIREVLRSAGIGSATGIELPESRGVFPSDEAKQRAFHTPWNAYDTALLSMGQGIVTVTPLQAALFAAAIGNGGVIWQPHLVQKVVDVFGNPLYERSRRASGTLLTTPANLELVKQGMFRVVNDGAGSGRRARIDGLNIYGKTGSAEVGRRSNLRINAWFIAFVTHEERLYSIAVLLEDATAGGRDSAPLAGEFFRRYLLEGERRP